MQANLNELDQQLLDRIAGVVRSLAAASAFVLVLDDLQWVDEASAALLHFLASKLTRGKSQRGWPSDAITRPQRTRREK